MGEIKERMNCNAPHLYQPWYLVFWLVLDFVRMLVPEYQTPELPPFMLPIGCLYPQNGYKVAKLTKGVQTFVIAKIKTGLPEKYTASIKATECL